MYHGEVTVNHDCLQGFLQTAETLHIRGLTDGLPSGQIEASLRVTCEVMVMDPCLKGPLTVPFCFRGTIK